MSGQHTFDFINNAAIASSIPDAKNPSRLTIKGILADYGSYGALGSSRGRAAVTEKIKTLNIAATHVHEEISSYAVEQLREVQFLPSEETRMLKLENIKCFLGGFNIFIQQNIAVYLEVLKIHMLSSNRSLANTARQELLQLRNQAPTKLEEW